MNKTDPLHMEPVRPDAAITQNLDLSMTGSYPVHVDILRLDLIHPVISGNKWYKLKYHFEEAVCNHYAAVLTYGGAWSNHIVATACMAQMNGLKATGIIRGEAPAVLSDTLQQAISYGMNIKFRDRAQFALEADKIIENLPDSGVFRIPQGGAGPLGIKGSQEIISAGNSSAYTHILCCIGTGTMFTGIRNALSEYQQLLGIPVLKGFDDAAFLKSIEHEKEIPNSKITILTGYHLGGYARRTAALIETMNLVFEKTGIATDFVYTGKMFYALLDLLEKKYFPPESRILLVHSGGLQGNASLPTGTLIY